MLPDLAEELAGLNRELYALTHCQEEAEAVLLTLGDWTALVERWLQQVVLAACGEAALLQLRAELLALGEER